MKTVLIGKWDIPKELNRKHGIDPIIGAENLVWVPNSVTGQHDLTAVSQVVDALRAVDEMGGDYDEIVEVLLKFGRIASER